jgi:hypothetical protein
MANESLRSGDAVQVKSAAEILATLDEKGRLDELPFMPEMLQHCGKRFVVSKRADKVCMFVHSRRVPASVMLDDLRCDGASHGGCQEECRLFWKEAWLRRVDTPAAPTEEVDEGAAARLASISEANARKDARATEGQDTKYVCQYTELLRASQGLALWDPRAYLRELTTGNVSWGRFLRVTTRAAVSEPLYALGLIPELPLKPTHSPPLAEPPLGLQPGEWVQVKTKEEIAATINSKGKTRGLWFDREMLPHCGKTYQVRMRVSRLINYETGAMIELKSDCVKLQGVVCSGDLSRGRWFCPRAIFPYWRECWLRRVEAPRGTSA